MNSTQASDSQEGGGSEAEHWSLNVSAQAKEQTEQALAATVAPLEVSRECLTLRDGRRDAELVMDPVDEELRKEVELAERAQGVLQQHIDSSFEQMW